MSYLTQKELNTRFVSARRRLIENEFSFLNDMQKKAVMTTQGPLLLLAGAGSGKTTVLINRIANILKFGAASDSSRVPEGITEGDLEFLESYLASPDTEFKAAAEEVAALDRCEPWRIMAITFTNKAANELKDRLSAAIGPEAGDIWAMTFHSACVRILRRYIDKLGYSSSFTIYDTADSISLIKRIMKELNISDKTFTPRTILSAISRAKDSLISPEEYTFNAEKSYDMLQKTVAAVYTEYARRLKGANALDFDDLIYQTVNLLRGYEDVRTYYQQRFKYILVDEYQDTNNLQYLLVSMLAGGYENICVVGDDDQSIYKFRGATIKNILDFENQYKNAKTIRLEQNYRSTSHILAAANSVIKNNVGRKGKNLWTAKGEGEIVTLHRADSEDGEAQHIAEKILMGTVTGQNFRDYAVLYRINTLSKGLEYAFKRNGIPYKIYGGTGFFERAEVKDMLAYLCVIANPEDDLRLLRIINTPARAIGAATVDKVRQAAAAENASMFDIMERADEYDELSRPAPRLKAFAALITSLRGTAEIAGLDVLYDELLNQSGYQKMLENSDDPQDGTRLENVLELKSSILSYMTVTEAPSLEGFLSEIALYTDLDNLDDGDNCVSLMTIHSAKGLEFPNVFIVGMEDGIFPSIHSIGEPDEMEEERRLCYVAITRAKERLTFTCSARRMLHGKTSANPVSRFVEEISSEDIELPPDAFRREFEPTYGVHREEYFADRNYGSGDSGWNYRKSVYDRDPAIPPAPKKTQKKYSLNKPVDASSIPDYKEGDRIVHTAFGPGTIVSLKPVGGDALVKIEFDGVGTKQLMLKTAAKFMTLEGQV